MQAATLPKARRLTTGADYRRVFSCRQRIDGRFVVLRCAPAAGAGARLGLAIGKRPCPRAIDRNRVKRVIREWFRRRASELPSADMVFNARPAVVGASNAALRADLDRLTERLTQKTQAHAERDQ